VLVLGLTQEKIGRLLQFREFSYDISHGCTCSHVVM